VYNSAQGRRGEMTLASGEILTPKQTAEYLQLSDKTVYRMIQSGELIAARVGGQYRIQKSNVDLFLASKSTGKESIGKLFEEVARVALRHSYDPEEIERDIAQAVEEVRRSNE
jgi:excisionase family DNA binding protein